MRTLVLGFGMAAAAWAQTITEYGAAAAAGTAGGAGGKQVSKGITAIFGKVDQQTKEAAKTSAATANPAPVPAAAAAAPASAVVAEPAPKAAAKPPAKAANATASVPKAEPKPETKAEKGPESTNGVGRSSGRGAAVSVPDPPPPAAQRAAVSKPVPVFKPAPEPVMAPILPPPPPPREATADDLKAIATGTVREEVLKLGAPASRMSMMDDGHLLEIYSYANSNATFGVVRLSDGAVSRVELR